MEVEEDPQEETHPAPISDPSPNPDMSMKTKHMIAAGFGYTVVPATTMVLADMAGAWATEQLEGVNTDGTKKPFTENPGLRAIIPVLKIGLGLAGIYGVHRKMPDSPWAPIGYGACGGVVISGFTDSMELIAEALETPA